MSIKKAINIDTKEPVTFITLSDYKKYPEFAQAVREKVEVKAEYAEMVDSPLAPGQKEFQEPVKKEYVRDVLIIGMQRPFYTKLKKDAPDIYLVHGALRATYWPVEKENFSKTYKVVTEHHPKKKENAKQ